jgi:protein-disulfide isomerase
MTPLLLALLVAAQAGSATPSVAPTAQPVEIVVFSDFQCPFCAQFARAFRELQTNGVDGAQTRFTFRNFPLGIHPKAPLAHQAALAAAEQGKFWEMHDLLFERQAAMERANLERYAQELDLDPSAFEVALTTGAGLEHVREDLQTGRASGVNATPKFFINGLRFDETDLRELVPAVERAAAER